MEAVYVLEPGAYLRREGSAIRVCKHKKVIDRIPAQGLKRLVLIGYISMTGGILDYLIKNRVETVFMTATGRYRARLGIDEHRHVALRRDQYLRLNDSTFSAAAARGIVNGKLENMRRFLLNRAREYKAPELRQAAARIHSIQTAGLENESNMERVRGFEGAATRIYFKVFGHMIQNRDFAFNGRSRRPPLDPVNALLSFVYTLLTNEVLSAIKAVGLDPYMGSLHDISYGRPSLACDLVEEYRSFLGDRMVLGIINRRMLGPDDFIRRGPPPKNFVDEAEMKAKRPVEMKPAVMRTFIDAYEAMMNRRILYPPDGKKIRYRHLLHRQAAAFAAALQDEKKDYQPFTWSV